MRLQMLLPMVEATVTAPPTHCPYGCGSQGFRHHQTVAKAVLDAEYTTVTVQRYACLRCDRTFRVYPAGVTRAPSSQRLQGLAVLLYLLGLSYGAVALALQALGLALSKTTVYEYVQAAAARVPGLKQTALGTTTAVAVGADLTSIRCQGQWLTLGVTVDAVSGAILTIDALKGADADTLTAWLTPIAQAVGAEVIVTDDADALKHAVDNAGLKQQVCKAHVSRNTAALVAELLPLAAADADGSLAAVGVTPGQAVADLELLEQLVHTRQPQDAPRLEQLLEKYLAAPPPGKGATATVAYRLRLLYLDRWNLWPRLTRYRTWRGPQNEQLDGTNNDCERGIGWGIKERYRTMRGYKREKSALQVSRLLAWCGNQRARGGARLATIL